MEKRKNVAFDQMVNKKFIKEKIQEGNFLKGV